VPALVLGMALLPVTGPLSLPLRRWFPQAAVDGEGERMGAVESAEPPVGAKRAPRRGRAPWIVVGLACLAAIAIGYPVQRHYLEGRYANPSFTTPGLNAAFEWARSTSGARIATTSTRQYPLFGTDLSNRVEFIGIEQPHGGFVAPASCQAWRRLIDEGDYDYVVASRDRIEPGRPTYPASARWTEGQGAEVILRKPPTVVFRLTAPLDPSTCP
jgi:hypothetical protein